MGLPHRPKTLELLVDTNPLSGPRAWVAIVHLTSSDLKGAEHMDCITSECRTFAELKAEIGALKADLDAVLAQASQHF